MISVLAWMSIPRLSWAATARSMSLCSCPCPWAREPKRIPTWICGKLSSAFEIRSYVHVGAMGSHLTIQQLTHCFHLRLLGWVALQPPRKPLGSVPDFMTFPIFTTEARRHREVGGQRSVVSSQTADIRGQRTEDRGKQSNFTASGNFPTNLHGFHEYSRARTLKRVFPRIHANLRE